MLSKLKTITAAAILLGMGLLAGCVSMPPETARIHNLDEKLVAGSMIVIHDNLGAIRIEFHADGLATGSSIYGTRGNPTGSGHWSISPAGDAICLGGEVWWTSHPCWSFYGPDFAHATDIVSSNKTFDNGYLRVEVKRTGLSN